MLLFVTLLNNLAPHIAIGPLSSLKLVKLTIGLEWVISVDNAFVLGNCFGKFGLCGVEHSVFVFIVRILESDEAPDESVAWTEEVLGFCDMYLDIFYHEQAWKGWVRSNGVLKKPWLKWKLIHDVMVI